MNRTHYLRRKLAPNSFAVQAVLPLSNLPRMPKQWKVLQSKSGQQTQKGVNAGVELAYKKVLAKAKHLLAHYSQLVFEKDQREDMEDSFAIYSFLSATFFARLECDITHQYRVEYAFCNCLFEAELRALLTSYPLKDRSVEINLAPDYNTFYKKVLQYQDKQYITTL